MRLLFDASVWIEHLRRAALEGIIEEIRGRFVLTMDVVVAAELRAGCRSKRERTVVTRLLGPYERSGRLLSAGENDFERASTALSRLRERGRLPSGAKAALLDALIGAIATRHGALLVTIDIADFERLATVMPLRVEGFESFTQRLLDSRARLQTKTHPMPQ
jgi:predicted nucleic acid-binding protein